MQFRRIINFQALPQNLLAEVQEAYSRMRELIIASRDYYAKYLPENILELENNQASRLGGEFQNYLHWGNEKEYRQLLKRFWELHYIAWDYADRQKGFDEKQKHENKEAARAQTLSEIEILRSSDALMPEITEQSVWDLLHAYNALTAFKYREADTFEEMARCVDQFSDYPDTRVDMVDSIKRGLRLMTKYKLVWGYTCDATIIPTISAEVIEFIQVNAGFVGTSQQHRLIGIDLKNKFKTLQEELDEIAPENEDGE